MKVSLEMENKMEEDLKNGKKIYQLNFILFL
jgi:hypothetical protein